MTDKERLERIIQMQYDGYTIWDMGENDLVWLIEQAERVQELEEDLTKYRNGFEFQLLINNSIKKQNKRYREALEKIKQKGELMNYSTGRESYNGQAEIARKALEGRE